ncbi:acetyl-CoA synthetase-like protein [Anaeromyces robustus]|uniref:Acetyl-CoA synthetase-like protein n=1 Tax=Anaeromyces robustus TaxID=1754192 RepID=A0A1Y1WNM4_9FUNG|nr:acetyl-CoA synthetase-like protein [Anaeromyces robustus]|eukprot:ORX75150.1 acetyl-CoA synthetase-like protein [Anaeromyces robustus]
MIPNYFKRIDKFELTNNGKLNRKALPEPDIQDMIKEEYVAPETKIEKLICHIYSKLLNIDENEIGKNNDFFELGGDSLNALRLISMIEKELNIKLNIKEIYEHSLIIDLSKYIEEILNNDDKSKDVEIIKKRNSKEFPVSSQQLGVYIDSIKNENTIIYNMPFSYKLNKNIDIEKIKEGFNKIFQNQEIFKTKYYSKEVNGKEEIYGFIDDECNLEFEEYTYNNATTFIRPFDLSKAPLIRIGFIGNDYLLIDTHHIISDGAGSLIIMNELNKYYNEGNISELEIQYSDYAIDMKEKQDNGFYDKQIEFYKSMFNTEYELAKLPEKEKDNNKLENDNNFNMNNLCSRIIDKSTSDMINEFIKKNGISKTSFFLTIYGFVLSKYSGQDIIYTSVINANRSNHYVENMVGMFVSTLPILLKYDKENESFIDTIKENMNTLIEMFNNQNISSAELNIILKLKKINNLFVFQPKISNNGNKSNENEIFDNEEYEDILLINDKNNNINDNKSKFDIEFSIIESKNEYLISVTFDNSIYDIETIDNLIDNYIEVIKNINKYSNSIKNIEYIPLNEKQIIIEKFNSDINVEGCDKFYHEEFSKMAKQCPDKCAIAYNDLRITYKELNEMSNSLGHYIKENGIERNDIIPIISDRSPYYIISMISISKAGGAFLPIDPKLPIEHIQFILEEVNPKMILYSNNQNIIDELLHLNEDYRVYDVQKHNYELNIESIDNINETDDICYVLFTSGTTGKPKGTLITHFNLCHYTRSINENCNNYCMYNTFIESNKIENVLSITNFSFDASHTETINSLIHGLKMVLADENIISNVSMLSKYIMENNVEFIKTTPTVLKLFMENEEFRKSVRIIKDIVLGGEALSIDLCKYVHQYSNCKIYNEYGPTECTVACTCKLIDEANDNKISIGKPFCDCKIYILDKGLKPVPIGVEGEIFIGGYGVGKGYLNREELTKEKFINNPFNYENDKHNEIIYRTGDLGKWKRNGEIEYLGRIDFQVKIHGQRIELGDIESKIQEIQGIKQCVVIDKVNENGNKYLISYYISEENINKRNIQEYLKKKLPQYMIPNYFKRVNKFKLTNNGKLDRKTLPEPDIQDMIKEEYVAPETETEKLICHIYSKLFNIDEKEIGKTSDFFEIGGDSLNAIRLISIIEKELNIKLNIKEIYEHSLIIDLSKYIEEILNSDDHSKDVEIIKKRNSKEFPITSQQLGVYIDSIKNENTIIYNIPSSFKLNKDVDIEKIKEGFNKIFHNQEILKTKYYSKEDNGKEEIYGFIDDECNLEFEEYTYDNASTFIRPFNLSKAPLIRIGFIGNEYLLIDTHHIISDGATSLIIMNELNKYYNEGNISELEIQYSDYAINMKEKQDNGFYDKQIEFYRKMFNIEYELINIPKNEVDSERDIKGLDIENSDINNITRIIDNSTSKLINNYVRNHGFSKALFFFIIYGYILSKYGGQDTIYSSIMNANRENHYKENMIGMFVSTIPVLLKYNNENEENTLLDFIKINNNILFEIQNNKDVSFSELMNSIKLKKINNSFIFQPKINSTNSENSSIFNVKNQKDDIDIFKSNISNEEINDNNSKFDITFFVIEDNENYIVSIEYNSNIYDNNTINNIISSYIEIFNHIEKYDNKIKEIEYIPDNHKEIILNKFNSDINKNDYEKLYHEEFSKIAKFYPERIAIIYNELKLSYKELDEMTNSLGNYLRKIGITRNDIIPIISDRSPYYVIGVTAISKAGGAFLPIDKKLPIERIKYILEEVRPKIILYNNNQDIIDKILLLNKSYIVYNLEKHNYGLNNDSINNINEPDDICYVLFTSGTTGKPKGALISHFNIYNNLGFFDSNNYDDHLSLCNLIKRENINNILGITNFSFDISHNEITFSLIHGLTITLVDDSTSENTELLINMILKNNVEFINTTPTRFKLFMENEKFRKILKFIKAIVFIGEELPLDLCKNIHQYSNCTIINGYGPTECTVTCTYKEINIENCNKITIGKPQCNYKIYILDKFLKPVPIGVEGEIFIGGYGVGIGYLNREELTKEKFINNPFNYNNDKHNEIIYRTGDLGKWTRNGEIEYLGRIDFQIKIHGQRIELGEIESIVNEIKDIKHGVVIDKKRENGGKYLVCYYQLFDNNENEIDGAYIRKYLKNKLPLYMIPNYYKKINEIPLTISGKLNRKELPDIDNGDIIKEEYVAPETETEKLICHIYSKLLNIDEKEIGKTSDFFELGGDSLNAIRLISVIEKELNIKLNVKEIYEHSLIIDLSKYIEEILNSDDHSKDVEIIKKRNSKEFPITSQQLGVYIDSIKNENTIIYNMPFSYKFNKDVNIEKIKEGFNQIFQNQEIFRTKYYSKEVNGKEEIYGFIDDECNLEFEEYTYDNASTFIRPFDLSKAPLIRIGFIGNDYLLIDTHHIISDGAGSLIIMNELNKYYNEGNISELEIQYSDYAIDMKEKQDNGIYDKQIEFYRKIFNAEYEIAKIPVKEKDNKLENDNNFNMNNLCSKIIDKSTSDMINKFIKKNGISKTSFFLTIYGFVLSKYSGQDIIYTSVINANRSNHYVENMVGMFVSTLPILLKYNKENESFIDTIKENMNTLIEIFNNQNISSAELNKILKLKKINNLFVFQPKISNNENKSNENEIFDNEEYEDVLSMNNENNNNINKSKFDIEFSIIEKENEYLILIQYDNSLYDNEIIGNLTDSYVEVVKNINKFENQNIDIEYLPLNEKQMIINKFNSDINVEGCDKFYHEEFSKISRQCPDKCAIVYNDLIINYKELNEMSNSLGHYIRENGIERNDIIPIISDCSPYYIISMVSISKAGGAFLPIDPKLPIERIQFILEEIKPKMILYSNIQDIIDELLHLNKDYRVYDVQKHNYELNIESIDNINETDDICYVLFTSGTTGKPKGTLITHFNLYNYIRSSQGNYDNYSIYNLFIKCNKINNILGITNFSFDPSHIETINSLIHRLNIILADENIRNNVLLLSEYILENNVELIKTTSTVLKLFMDNKEFRECIGKVKAIVLGGEVLSMDLCKYVHQYSNCKIYNEYGPTECTIACSCKLIDERVDNQINIGKPLCNCKVYILDKYLKPVPIGVEGEIFIGGYGVGKGYLNREELTKEKFINNPFNYENDSHNKIIYRTGDLGKWTRNGEIEYLGRIDFQVKIHGQRVELGEIESIIQEIQEIKQCVVIDKKKENEEKYLVCYYQLLNDNNENEINGADIRKYLKTKLPLYMIPNYYKKINEIPLTINGKLNRKELPDIDNGDIIKEEYVAPETETEKLICHIYSKLFNIDEKEIGKTSDFFELGGDSLNAIRIISEIRKKFNIKISIKNVIYHSTVSSLSKLIEESYNKEEYRIQEIKKYNNDEFPITTLLSFNIFNKEEINLEKLKDIVKNNNMYRYYKLPNNITIEKINEIFNIIINRHSILKVKFIEKEERNNNGVNIYGKIRKDCQLKVERYNNSNFKEFIRPYDITKDLLIRVGIIEYLNILIVDINHIIGDGYSHGILRKEMFDLIKGEELKELPIQYSDYAIKYDEEINSERVLNQMKYYENLFNKPINTNYLDKKENQNTTENAIEKKSDEAKIKVIDTDKETYDNINAIVKKYNISKTAFFITIYSLILSIYSGEKELLYCVVNSNRSNEYTENLIGLFAKFVPVLISIDNMNLVDLIKKSMDDLLTLFNNDVPFLKFDIPKPNLYYQFNPFGLHMEDNKDIMNVIEDLSTEDINELFGTEDSTPKINKSEYDMELIIDELKDSYKIGFIYKSSLINENDINEIINNFLQFIKNEEFLVQDIEKISQNYIKNKNLIESKNIHNIDIENNKNDIDINEISTDNHKPIENNDGKNNKIQKTKEKNKDNNHDNKEKKQR